MKKLSIIIPVFNVEDYIEECLNSVVNQDIEDYEILIIDDGSTDNSIYIINEFLEKFPSIFQYYYKLNGGLSDARNYGIERAKGEYLLFLDSDDFLKYNCLSGLLEEAKTNSSDIIVFNHIIYSNDKKCIIKKNMKKSSNISVQRKYILTTPSACVKLVRTKIFKENHIQFKKGIWYEDLATIPGLIKYANKVDYYDKELYFYRERENSITQQKKYNEKFLDIIFALDNLSLFFTDEYKMEYEFLVIHHLLYGGSLRIIAFKEYKKLHKLIDYMKKFPNWNSNIYFKEKPFLYRFYCNRLINKNFNLCFLLYKFKVILKDQNRS